MVSDDCEARSKQILLIHVYTIDDSTAFAFGDRPTRLTTMEGATSIRYQGGHRVDTGVDSWVDSWVDTCATRVTSRLCDGEGSNDHGGAQRCMVCVEGGETGNISWGWGVGLGMGLDGTREGGGGMEHTLAKSQHNYGLVQGWQA